MENNLTLEIKCQGATTVPLNELIDLQGNLKTLSENDYVKLRNSMTEFGFSFPVFYWEDEEGKKWIVDAHQRRSTLLKMEQEGWSIPPLPACPIFAKDKREAKKKLAVLQSRYGKINAQGVSDFLNEEGAEIPFEEISDMLSYPEEDFKHWANGTDTDIQKKEKQVKCPNCGHEFVAQ